MLAAAEGRLVLLADCDMVVTNPSIQMTEVFAQHAFATTQLVVARDEKWSWHDTAPTPVRIPINSGDELLC